MKKKMIIKNDKGEEKEVDILFSFTSTISNKEIITYTDYSKDDKGDINCYSAYYDNGNISEITNEQELSFIDDTLSTILETLKERYK